jgi:hypothetical protein
MLRDTNLNYKINNSLKFRLKLFRFFLVRIERERALSGLGPL